MPLCAAMLQLLTRDSPEFFAEALNNDKERILECLRAHLTAGLAEGEVYVAEDSDGKPIGLTLWYVVVPMLLWQVIECGGLLTGLVRDIIFWLRKRVFDEQYFHHSPLCFMKRKSKRSWLEQDDTEIGTRPTNLVARGMRLKRLVVARPHFEMSTL